MVKLKCWKKTDNRPRYKVWVNKQTPSYAVVSKTEEGKWHTFRMASDMRGKIYSGKSKIKAIKSANNFLKKHDKC